MKKTCKSAVCIAICIISLGLTACSTNNNSVNESNKEKIKNIKMPLEDKDVLQFDIYFDGSKEGKTPTIEKEEIVLDKEEVVGEKMINTLIKGPSIQSDLSPIVPPQTRLLSFSIKDHIAVVNLSKEAAVKMSASKEEVCLKSIITTLTELPSVEKVQMLIENNNVESLGGNYKLTDPMGKDDVLVKLEGK
ncbi:GerMN domain-containing protein [Clostridium frigidicarnis]|uniref:Sporulation and spore germination n=1 Tax=Clostridium frigidicarnis TaxID=84698 RepID=A0A1I1ATN1_9CLOT|nr:GerMN domain-containing protein [Clostridium frigidicarnis]SFB39673.1 Sporulation and spore germination [Clostridium frigidicarnis]